MKRMITILIVLLIASMNLLFGNSINRSIRVEEGERINRSLKSINGSIHIGDKAVIEGDCQTVNGSVQLGENVHVKGNCETVNGSITLGDSCSVDEVQTTNGRIEIGESCEILGKVMTTNGRLSLNKGTTVKGFIKTTNGSIELKGVSCTEDILMSNGEIRVDQKSHVQGNIEITPSFSSSSSFFGLIRKSSRNPKPIEVFISGHSIVEGDIIVKNDKRHVIVYIAPTAEVKGKIINAEQRVL